MDSLFNMLDTNCNKFYFDESNKKKIIIYQIYKKYQNTYTSHIKKEEYNIGEQLCDFLNTDVETPDSEPVETTPLKPATINFSAIIEMIKAYIQSIIDTILSFVK